MKILEAIATLATIISLYFLSEGVQHGFTIGLFSNILWMFWAHEKNAFGILITNALLLIINLNGLGVV
jgi:nicotinamide riboside transporter PnuC